MKLSAPIYQLKRQAKLLSRADSIPLHEALNRVAIREGFSSWSLLAARVAMTAESKRLYRRLSPGDLVLLGARPSQGKTVLSLQLAQEAMEAGHRAVFFTLEYTESQVLNLAEGLERYSSQFQVDGSDDISADYVTEVLREAPKGTFAVIDYLQLLDQKRRNPDLMDQVRDLKAFARSREIIVLCISQISRSYDAEKKPYPDATDVRLPNPLDLNLFNKTFFLHEGRVRLRTSSG